MATRIFAIALDKDVVENDVDLKPMLNNQLIDWDRYNRDTPSAKALSNYIWDGPNVMTVWDIIVTHKPIIDGHGNVGDSFIMEKDEILSFIEDGLEQTQGFVRNKFIKLQSLVNVFDFDKQYLVFFFS